MIETTTQIVPSSHIVPRREWIALRLAHVDTNLANFLQATNGLRWVDWEFIGWGDPALELADLRWHIALDRLTIAQHNFLRESYRRPKYDPDFEERLGLWDTLLATRWTLFIARNLWSLHNGPDRVRLTMPRGNPFAIRERLVRTIERAEQIL